VCVVGSSLRMDLQPYDLVLSLHSNQRPTWPLSVIRYWGSTPVTTVASHRLTLWRPLLPSGYCYKAFYAIPG